MPETTRNHPSLGDSHAIVSIAGMRGTAQGRAVREMIDRKMESLRREIEGAVEIPDVKLRHSIGQVAALRWIIDRFDEASSIVEEYK